MKEQMKILLVKRITTMLLITALLIAPTSATSSVNDETASSSQDWVMPPLSEINFVSDSPSSKTTYSIEYIGIVIDEEEFNDIKVVSDDKVTISLPETRFTFINVPSNSDVAIPMEILPGNDVRVNIDNAVLLWAPVMTVDYTSSNGIITLSANEELFMAFDSLNDLYSVAEDTFYSPHVIDEKRLSVFSLEQQRDDTTLYQERTKYDVRSGYQVFVMKGTVGKFTYSNAGNSGYTIYHETEIYYDNNDCLEVIAGLNDPVWNSQQEYFVFVYDNHDDGHLVLNVFNSDVPNMEYQVFLISGVYYVYLRNPVTYEWHTATYTDTTPSTYIDCIHPSSEYYMTTTSPTLYVANTIIEDEVETSDNVWRKPNTVLTQSFYPSASQYVSVTSSWLSDGSLKSSHASGTNVA